MRELKVALFGTGTVGGGCVRILQNHHDDFVRHCGVDLKLARVTSLEPEVAAELGVGDIFCTPEEIFADDSIDIVIELVGGTGFAHEVVKRSLESGKNVVTANKALMATAGKELMHLADDNGLFIAFEAAVGGGIPIIGPLKHSLIANEISSVLGIVNGTTNYMLTRMGDGLSYDEALKEAQDKGFAEANPTADVDGFDAAAKIAILASIAFNSRVTLDEVPAEGIRSISPLDLDYARTMGYTVKLLAIANRTDEGVDIRVHPTMLPEDHPLSGVNGVYNAIYVTGDAVGSTMFFGEGAGAGPAASAVMGDVIEVARSLEVGAGPIVGCTCTDTLPLRPMSELETQYYIRLDVVDEPGTLAKTSAVFGEHGVSINSVVQREPEDGSAQLVFVTHIAKEADVRAALEVLASMPSVNEVATVIRVEA